MASRKKDDAAELAEKMVQVLEAQSRLGPESYPLTVKRLGELTDAQAAPEQVLKALGKKPLKDRAVVIKKQPQAPIALSEDTEKLAGSPLLLEFALRQACKPAKPYCAIGSLKTKVGAKLWPSFEAAVTRRVQEQTLPPTVASILIGNAQQLHLLEMPLPKKPEVVLAEKLVQVLGERRRRGGDAYPVRLDQLLEETGLAHPLALVKKAVAIEPFKNGAMTAAAKFHAETPVALAEDRMLLANSRPVLEFTLKAGRKKDNQAFPLPTLVKSIATGLQRDFERTVGTQLDTDALPPGIGWIWISKKKQLFLLDDVHGHRHRAPDTTPRPVQADFESSFDQAFRQLNQQSGSHNFISLVDLRRALPLAREAFDAGLRRLRQAGRYSLSAAEGRHGISAEEREAGVIEDGTLLLYVSRKAP